jgi:hypothetical protein
MLDRLHGVQFSSYEKPKVEVGVQGGALVGRAGGRASAGSCASAFAELEPIGTQASLPLHENVRGPGYYH